jgi:hypothetical protein
VVRRILELVPLLLLASALALALPTTLLHRRELHCPDHAGFDNCLVYQSRAIPVINKSCKIPAATRVASAAPSRAPLCLKTTNRPLQILHCLILIDGISLFTSSQAHFVLHCLSLCTLDFVDVPCLLRTSLACPVRCFSLQCWHPVLVLCWRALRVPCSSG